MSVTVMPSFANWSGFTHSLMAYWRDNARETEIDAGGLDCGLAGLNLSLRSSNGCLGGLYLGLICKIRLRCVVEILLADGISLCQRSVLLYIELALELVRLSCRKLRLVLNQLRLRLRQLALCLIECRLEWTRIDLKEKLSLADERSFLIVARKQVARDLRFHVGIHLPGESSDPFSINGNISLLDGCDLNHG